MNADQKHFCRKWFFIQFAAMKSQAMLAGKMEGKRTVNRNTGSTAIFENQIPNVLPTPQMD